MGRATERSPPPSAAAGVVMVRATIWPRISGGWGADINSGIGRSFIVPGISVCAGIGGVSVTAGTDTHCQQG